MRSGSRPPCSNPLLSIAIIVIGCLVGCSATSTAPPPVVIPPATLQYHLSVQNLRPLDTSRLQYVLWIHSVDSGTTETQWTPINLTKWTRGSTSDSLLFSGQLSSAHGLSAFDSALLSIESTPSGAAPTDILLAGKIHHGEALLEMEDSSMVNSLRRASGSALFITKSADTNRAKNEFYLMSLASTGIPQTSVNHLPIATTGWIYGLWVLDSSFFPPHQILYGYFADPNRADTNATNAAYPFPGGYNPAPLTDAGARIAVTLEPIALLASTGTGQGHTAPSPIEILSAQLHRFLSFGDTVQFQNVWQASTPSGTLTLSN